MRIQALTQQLGFLPGEAVRLEQMERSTRKDDGKSVRQRQEQSQLRPEQPSLIEGCRLTAASRFSQRNSTPARYHATSRAAEDRAPVR
jgi:hypothetical protein